ncbi:MAG: carbohydrate kinase [Burkholderiaceae bacterium]
MFVVCGEALFDVFAAGDTPAGMALDARIGGSPFNVAVGLARLRQPVAFFGGVSRGFLGERLGRALRDEGIATEAVAWLDAPTTLSLVGVDARGVPSYSFYGDGAADRELPLAAAARVPDTVQALHLGSYAMVVEPVASAQRALVERLHPRCVVAYDPNVRANVEPDLGRWRATLDWMAPRTHVLKASEEDLALLYPGVPHAELAARWHAAGVTAVVVTLGGEGARAHLAGAAGGDGMGGELAVAPRPTRLVDTVGAGDSFQAAMLAALAERGALSPPALRQLPAVAWGEVLGFAAQAAALTCGRRGADLPRRAELR